MTTQLMTALAILLGTTTLAMANDFTFTMTATNAITGVRTIDQAGLRNDLDVAMTGSMHTLTINQDGNDNDVDITSAGSLSTSAAAASLNLQITGNDNVVNSSLASRVGVLAPTTMDSQEVITGDDNVVTNDIDADSIAVDVTLTGDDNTLDTTVTAPSVALSMYIMGDLNTVEHDVSASTFLSSDTTIFGDSNTLKLAATTGSLQRMTLVNNVTGYSNTVNNTVAYSGAVISSDLTLNGSSNTVTLAHFGFTGHIEAVLAMSGRNATVYQYGVNSSLTANVNAWGSNQDYFVNQAANLSTITDTVHLGASAASYITVGN